MNILNTLRYAVDGLEVTLNSQTQEDKVGIIIEFIQGLGGHVSGCSMCYKIELSVNDFPDGSSVDDVIRKIGIFKV